jgi:hypothetical protein
MNENTSMVEPTEFLNYWLKENDYFDPQFVPGQGWFAFKKGDFIPVCIQHYLTNYGLRRQRVHPSIDLLD